MDHDLRHEPASRGATALRRASLLALIVGILAYGFFVLTDHENWFHMRIGSGTAQAMAHATDN